jgi:four helix bundle protein
MNLKQEREANNLTGDLKNEKEKRHQDLKNDKEKRRQDLKKRLKQFALRIIRLYESLPKTGAVHVITHQLLRSGTLPGAQYLEACRAKSNADFISKIEGALQELEESLYWLELLIEGGFVAENKLKPLCDETDELISMFVSMTLKAKSKTRANKD